MERLRASFYEEPHNTLASASIVSTGRTWPPTCIPRYCLRSRPSWSMRKAWFMLRVILPHGRYYYRLQKRRGKRQVGCGRNSLQRGNLIPPRPQPTDMFLKLFVFSSSATFNIIYQVGTIFPASSLKKPCPIPLVFVSYLGNT